MRPVTRQCSPTAWPATVSVPAAMVSAPVMVVLANAMRLARSVQDCKVAGVRSSTTGCEITRIVVPSEGLSAAEAEAAAAMSPEQFFDYRNEDPALRNRPMQDLHMLTLRPGNKPTIYDGEIYNPQDGKTYSGYVELTGPDSMRLNGCVLYNVICRGEDWVRVPQAELDARLEAQLQQ